MGKSRSIGRGEALVRTPTALDNQRSARATGVATRVNASGDDFSE